MIHWIWQQPGWPKFSWDETKISLLLSQARLNQGRLLGLTETFTSETKDQINAQMLAEEMVTSSAIEGEIINQSSVRSSIEHRLGLKHAGLTPSSDRYIEGVLDMMLDATENHHLPLDLERLLGWQASLFPTGYSGIRKINVGKLRGEGDVLQQTTSGELDITLWLEWFLNCYINAINRSMNIINDICLESKYWQKHAKTILNERQQKVLNKMLDKGTDGYKGGMATRKYIAVNKVSRARHIESLLTLLRKNVLSQWMLRADPQLIKLIGQA